MPSWQPRYRLSRPYPFRWFLPVATVLLAASLGIFSWLNYIASAYSLATVSTTDPNSTIADYDWLERWPSYFTTQIQPRCQAQSISINSEFFTNQTALMYTVTNIWNATDPTTLVPTPSFLYTNQPLESCSVDTVLIEFAAEDRAVAQYAWGPIGQTMTAYVSCAVENNGTKWIFNMTSEYDFIPPTSGMPTKPRYTSFEPDLWFSFLSRDSQNKASLYWGESLLSVYWSALSGTLFAIREQIIEAGLDDSENLRKGAIYFKRHNLLDPYTDITNPNFWDVDYRWVMFTVQLQNERYPGNSGVPGDIVDVNLTLSELEENAVFPNVWGLSDGLAKSFYSSILTDLGQVEKQPNILLDASALTFFTHNFTGLLAINDIPLAYPGPMNKSYAVAGDQTGPLGTTPSVISTTYTCQVPVARSTGAIVLSVFLADLVFVQAVWKIFTFITSVWVQRSYPDANVCTGCKSQPAEVNTTHEPSILRKPLLPPRPRTVSIASPPLSGGFSPVDASDHAHRVSMK